jgi:hypothetical protein
MDSDKTITVTYAGINDPVEKYTPDIIWQNQSSGETKAWTMNGVNKTGEFNIATLSNNWKVVGTADFNKDGARDIVWQNGSTGDISIWYMGDTSILSYQAGGGVPDANWKIVGLADFDGDGSPDYLWQHQTRGDIYVWLMGFDSWWGIIVKSGAEIYGDRLNSQWKLTGTADFNNDGKPDLLWRNTSTGEIKVWYMNGTTKTGEVFTNPAAVGTDWNIVGLGDFNNDGKPNILWQNNSTGELYVWYMDGVNMSSGSSVNPNNEADINWKVDAVWP